MTTKSLEAWVIHKQWSGDTSARVLFFTQELGLVQCLCRGGRTPKKQALLQAFTPIWLAMTERYGLYYAQTLEPLAPSLPLQGHALFSALYLNELLYHALKPLDAQVQLFEGYLYTLNQLTDTKERQAIEVLLRRFEWTLLQACGCHFSLQQEARTQQDIKPDFYYQLVAQEGLVRTEHGVSGKYILALAEDNFSEVETLQAAKLIMRKAIDYLLGGRQIKARSLYTQS